MWYIVSLNGDQECISSKQEKAMELNPPCAHGCSKLQTSCWCETGAELKVFPHRAGVPLAGCRAAEQSAFSGLAQKTIKQQQTHSLIARFYQLKKGNGERDSSRAFLCISVKRTGHWYGTLAARSRRSCDEMKFYSTTVQFSIMVGQPTVTPRGFPTERQFYTNVFILMCNCKCMVQISVTFSEGVFTVSALEQSEVFPPQESLRFVFANG